MAQYMKTANEANKKIMEILTLIGDDCSKDTKVMILLAQLYNLRIRTAPRAVQSTVRLNAVKEACKGLPVSVTMEKVTDDRTGNEYNALNIQPKGE